MVDNQAPDISCPDGVEVALDENCEAQVPNVLDGLLVGECSNYTLEQTPLAGTIVSTETTIHIVVEDENGNWSECFVPLTITGGTGPTFECPENTTIISVECEYVLPNFVSDALITSSCGETNWVQSPEAGTTVNIGEIVSVELTLQDSWGTTSCEFEYLIEDTSAPVVECSANIELFLAEDECELELILSDPMVSGECGQVNIVQASDILSGSFVGVGEYIIAYEISDAFGNTTECDYLIQVFDTVAPVINCPGDIVQCDSFVEFELPTAFDQCGEVIVEQTDASGLNSGMAFPQGTTTLTFYAEDAYGNSSECEVNVTNAGEIIVPWSTIPSTICDNDDAIDLSAYVTGDPDGEWSGAVDLNGIFDPTSVDAGIYDITLSITQGGCEGDSTQKITVVPSPLVEAGSNSDICGLAFKLSAESNGTSLEWSGDGEFVPNNTTINPQVVVEPEGTYEFEIVASNEHCSASDIISVDFYAEPENPDAGEDQELIGITETELNGQYNGPGNYFWETNSGSALVHDEEFLESFVSGMTGGSHEFILWVENGVCPPVSDTCVVDVLDLIIPTGFSPNGDLSNDSFEINGLENYPGSQLRVFNRWGNEVYRSDDYQNDWGGLGVNGQPLPSDTYFAIIQVGEIEYSGYMVLKR